MVTFHVYYSIHRLCFWFLLECLPGWVNAGKLGCYFAAREVSAMTHANAKAYCKSLDRRAHLAELRTQEIQSFVVGLKDFQRHVWWWLGGNDKAKVWNISCW